MRSFIERLIHLQNPGIFLNLVLFPLTLCSYLFKAVVVLRELFYRKGIFKSRHLPCRVISIGNITVGGTGKTPATYLLARYLKNAGFKVAVLSRGYRTKGSIEPLIISDGKNVVASPEAAGDEAFMLAKKLSGVPVLAGKNRFLLGQRAIQQFSSQIVILDDGFQHYPLQRDLDIVLINARNPFGNGFLLPRGILREPLSSLSRSHLVLLTKIEETTAVEKLAEVIKRHSSHAHIFTASIQARALRRALDDAILPFAAVRGKQAVGLCSIGDPESFFSLLERFGLIILKRLAFPDHHWYGDDDYTAINACGRGADFIVTTEKDVAKLNNNMVNSHKLFILETELHITGEDNFFQTISRLAGL
jgi:tetraacyldisaccharide 4'-kinase